MRYTLITQLVLVTLSIVLILTFLKPAFADIKGKQDDLFLYKDTVAKVEELNKTLQGLVATKNAFSEKDLQTLNLFIPERIDSIKVMRDIESIFEILERPLLSLTAAEIVAPAQNTEIEYESAVVSPEVVPVVKTVHQDYTLAFIGSYSDMKKLLEMLERNETLLEVLELSIRATPDEAGDTITQNVPEGLFSVSITLRTFGLSAL